MYTRSEGWHTDLSLGWRPAARAALAARPWETGGRHPNVITAAKLLSIKAKLQKYVAAGLLSLKTEPVCCPAVLRKESCIMSTLSKRGRIKDLQPDTWKHVRIQLHRCYFTLTRPCPVLVWIIYGMWGVNVNTGNYIDFVGTYLHASLHVAWSFLCIFFSSRKKFNRVGLRHLDTLLCCLVIRSCLLA